MHPPVSKSISHISAGNSSNAHNLGSGSFLKNLQMATHSCLARPTIHHWSTFDECQPVREKQQRPCVFLDQRAVEARIHSTHERDLERASRRSRLRAPEPDRAVAPRQADTTIWPSCENATALTQSEWTNNSNRLRKQIYPAQN
jgi:hypothetical protein